MATFREESDKFTYNILLMGETGVGKSTFINAFINYLTYSSLEEAEKGESIYLIPTTFTVTDDNFKPRTLTVGNDENEVQVVGASATQTPRSYVFSLGQVNIRFIDTPGIGDTRGADQDNINFDMLLSYIGEFKELHAICILLKPNEARITVMFEYCIKQLLSRLEKSASQNIMFVFTNSRGTLYRPGETLQSLIKLFEDTQRQPPYVAIPLSKQNIFCTDGEAFRVLIICKAGITFTDIEKKNFIASWEQSSNECLRMVTYIKTLRPHKVQNTISVNEARRLITQLSQPLADIAELIQKNIAIMQNKKDELGYYTEDMEELKKSLYIPVVNLKIDEISNPRTVCASSKCCEVYTVNGKEIFHCEKACCDPCHIPKFLASIFGAGELVFCRAMITNSDSLPEIIKDNFLNRIRNLFLSATNQSGKITCAVCGCSYKLHKHIYYTSTPYQENIVNDNVNSQIKSKESAKAAVERTINDIEERCKKYDEEQQFVNTSVAKFANFLQNNSITPYNDAYEQFLEYTINREQSCGINANKKRIQMFQNILDSYIKDKMALKEILLRAKELKPSESCTTAADVMSTVNELYKLQIFGSKIQEMCTKQHLARRSENRQKMEVKVKTQGTSQIFNRLRAVFF